MLIFIFLLLIIQCSLLIAQSGWVLQQSSLNNQLVDIFFINPQTGWISADSGKVFKTTNGGSNWTKYLTGCNLTLRTIKFADSQTGWAAGGDGYTNPLGAEYSIILKTTNGGINWIQQFYSDFGPIYYEMSVINQDKVFAIFSGLDYWSGTMGGVTKTTNGGINWLPDSSAAVYRSAYNSIYFVNQTGWIICYRSVEGFPGPIKVIKTTNTGQSWFVAYQDTTTRFFHRKIQFIDSQIGYVSKPRFRKSTNGGSNWYIMDSLMTSGNSDAFFVNKDTGWICGNFSGNNYLRRTNNGGQNWVNQIVPSGNYPFKFYFINSNIGWGITYSGNIIKTTSGGETFIQNISSEIPDKYSLYQNYPNPFNPTTKIKFDILSEDKSPKAKVKIVIFDILGKEIQTLVNETLNPGTYEVTFDGSNYASGVYFYQLRSGNFIETKKLILLK